MQRLDRSIVERDLVGPLGATVFLRDARLPVQGKTRQTWVHQFTTLKIKNFYVAYASDFDVSAYAGCRDEAVNILVD